MPAYAQAMAQVSSDETCERRDFEEVIVFMCRGEPAAWYFTHEGDEAHPGYFKRSMFVRDDATYMQTRAHSDGPDAQQPAFQAWMASVAASLMRN